MGSQETRKRTTPPSRCVLPIDFNLQASRERRIFFFRNWNKKSLDPIFLPEIDTMSEQLSVITFASNYICTITHSTVTAIPLTLSLKSSIPVVCSSDCITGSRTPRRQVWKLTCLVMLQKKSNPNHAATNFAKKLLLHTGGHRSSSLRGTI